MAARTYLSVIALAATLLAAASCVYPYEVEIPETDYPLVVEGDIHLGGYTSLFLSKVIPVNGSELSLSYGGYTSSYASSGAVQINLEDTYIEGEDGIRIPGTHPYAMPGGTVTSSVYFDTANLRDDQRYRLHCDIVEDILETEWIEVCKAPVIDALSYQKNDAFKELRIGLSMHCSGSSYFRWSYSETWEYHSYVNSDLWYDPVSRRIGKYWINGQPSNYYCWNSRSVGKINIFSTENQIDDRFEDLDFHEIPLDDMRLQILYRLDLQLEAMSKDAYAYWNNIQQNSEQQGSLFAPIPSQMIGNIRCKTHPDRVVIGYINAARPAEGTLWYDNSVEQFYDPTHYRPNLDSQQISAGDFDKFDELYKQGYLPYQEVYEGMSDSPSHYRWGMAGCVDCRQLGGTKNKPKDWPSGHN